MEYDDGKLSGVCIDLEAIRDIPPEKRPVTELDVSENLLSDVAGLQRFASVKTLILDNNDIQNFEDFPLMSNLETLWINKNNIKDLDALLGHLQGNTPSLQYLSLLGNPVCKNELAGCNRDEISRYRIYVSHHLPSLMFLDASPLSPDEKQQGRTRGNFLKLAKAQEKVEAVAMKEEQEFYKETPNREGNHSTFLGYQKHGYSGKSSEGNRFIKDDQL
eukprot:TRINITY_DN73770_c0_g1_i1.p1 TRINITY_DN73770_c0_g1~~TRINITY_DN73770_c0_g1_i1.p1  ORF type:complete len:229 (+),score=77.41 TRINITY_DN73770_c0_g1_i1:35-688(+)